MDDFRAYLGIPYLQGGREYNQPMDCWGITRQVIDERLGVLLPKLDHVYKGQDDDDSFAADLAEWEQVERPFQLHDVLLFRIGGKWLHTGVAFDNLQFLTATAGEGGTCMAKFDREPWTSSFEGAYRHVSQR